MTDRSRIRQARHTNKILQLDSTGRQTEMIFFDDMVRRNAATVQYLAQWSIDVVANIVPTFVSNTESGPLRLNTGENVDLVLNDDEDEHEHGELQESPRYFGHFTHPVRVHFVHGRYRPEEDRLWAVFRSSSNVGY